MPCHAARQITCRTCPSPVGPVYLEATALAIRRVAFDTPDRLPPPLPRTPATSTDAERILDAATAQLEEYFAGRRRRFELPLDAAGTRFQEEVRTALCGIPFGSTASYRTIAARIGRPTATRAVGMACARNPLAIIVPCHRVVGSDGSLTGYAGGIERKLALLRHESPTRPPSRS